MAPRLPDRLVSTPPKTLSPAVTLAALGVVFGDIGTSPLYAVKEVFGSGRVPLEPQNILGIVSMLLWTLTVIVSVKYVTLVLRADNRGEGGLVAMLTLASQALRERPRLRRALLAVGIFGAALFFGDGVITPAISVLSAIEGMELIAPHLADYVIPVTLTVLAALFAFQRHGTAGIGRYFGPVMLVWFIAAGALGVYQVAGHPEILAAVNPAHALGFAWRNPALSFVLLGAIVLCVTGAEALYADLGHFGRRPIRVAWFGVAMPALILNYAGQGALLLADPAVAKSPFFLLAPAWALLPLVLLATLATVIASQALISGAFSVTRQVIQLGYLPRLSVVHTSVAHAGQIYVPFVNWSLFAAIVLAVVMFRSSSALAGAYGIAVTLNMTITTLMTFFVLRYVWRHSLVLCLAATAAFLVVDGLFLASNLLKLLDGGWFPLLIGGGIFALMMTWKQGRRLMREVQRAEAVDLRGLLDSVFMNPPARVEGTAVFLTIESGRAPSALLHNLRHNKVLHAENLFVTVRYHETPRVALDRRVEVEPLGHHCWQVVVNYGYANDIDIPGALGAARLRGCRVEPMSTSYFLSRDVVIPRLHGGMVPWREKLFAQMHHGASGAADFLGLPANAVIELGSKVEI
jgi:KUP system potassium uptake protein